MLFTLAASAPDPSFRTSLTATVQESSTRDGCRDVVLTWRAHPAAKRYRVLVSQARDGAWAGTPAKTGCARAASSPILSFIDREPVTQASNESATWLFYRVVAMGASAPLDTTDAVPVELTLRKPSSADLTPTK